MRNFLIAYLCLTATLGWSDNLTDHLNTDFVHTPLKESFLDAAFIVRLYDRTDTKPLVDSLKSSGIEPLEYNNFNILPMKTMSTFCSAVVSPYLLTQTLSHLSLYQYSLTKGLKQVLIMEDQASVQSDVMKLKKVIKSVQKSDPNWDIIYTDIDYHHAETGEIVVPCLAEIPQNKTAINDVASRLYCRYGTVSYVISERGMKKILEYFNTHLDNLPYDQVLFKIPDLHIFTANEDIITNKYSTGPKKKVTKKPKKPKANYEVGEEIWIAPEKLLSFDRIDIIPKFIYALYMMNGYSTSWHIDMYRSHLEKWVQCYNTKPLKIGFQAFTDSFNELIASLQTKGFDADHIIDMTTMHVPWNGAHRIGTSLALGSPVRVKVVEERPSQKLTLEAFRNKYHLEEKYLDHIALEFTKHKKDTYIVCLYPQATDQHVEVEKILQNYGTIIHTKEIPLSETGMLEFIRLVYTGEWWTGSFSDDFKHSRGKVLLAFPNGPAPVRVYLYECEDHYLTSKAKLEIRQKCNVGDQAVHINDTHSQTIKIAQTLFNQNSLDFINSRSLQDCAAFEHHLDEVIQTLQAQKIDPETVFISEKGSAAAYGKRASKTLDVIHRKADGFVDDILFNPDNYFYYNGIKFIKPKTQKGPSLTRMTYQKNEASPITKRELALVQHTKNSIELSLQMKSKLSDQNFQNILDRETWRKEAVIPFHNIHLKHIPDLVSCHLLNNLCSLPKASHLHIGLLAGDSFVAALYGNQTTLTQQIGVDWFQECAKDLLYRNCELFLNPSKYQFVNGDCFATDKKLFKKPVDIYFYDADHSPTGHQNAFLYYNDVLANTFIAVVDDWDCPWIRAATFRAFDYLGYSILYDSSVPFSGPRDTLKLEYVAVIRKGKQALQRKEIPSFKQDSKEINEEKKLVYSKIEGGWCSKDKASLIMDVILTTSPQVCVEIGSFTGSTFLPIVSALKLCKNGHAYAIDAWSNEVAVEALPPSEHYDWWSSVDMKEAYASFCSALESEDLSFYFTAIKSSSAAAASKFSEIDFLHLDGSFSQEGTESDFELYFPKVRSGGYILLSNAYFSIHDEFFKGTTLCALIEQCDVIMEVDNDSMLFRKP